MRRSSTGLYLRALAGSEVAGSSIGISPARARITAFAVCAGIAATGGALLSMREGAANYQADFTVQFALFWLVLVVTLGSRTVEGALIAAFALKFFPELLNGLGLSQSWQYILFGLGAIAFARHPEGTYEHFKRTSQNLIQRLLDRNKDRTRARNRRSRRRRPAPRSRGREVTASEPLLVAEHVRVTFSGITALDDVSLTVGEREIVGLIGPNGAGKTTLFNCLFGTLAPNVGTVRFGGENIGSFPTHKRAARDRANVPTHRAVLGHDRPRASARGGAFSSS